MRNGEHIVFWFSVSPSAKWDIFLILEEKLLGHVTSCWCRANCFVFGLTCVGHSLHSRSGGERGPFILCSCNVWAVSSRIEARVFFRLGWQTKSCSPPQSRKVPFCFLSGELSIPHGTQWIEHFVGHQVGDTEFLFLIIILVCHWVCTWHLSMFKVLTHSCACNNVT